MDEKVDQNKDISLKTDISFTQEPIDLNNRKKFSIKLIFLFTVLIIILGVSIPFSFYKFYYINNNQSPIAKNEEFIINATPEISIIKPSTKPNIFKIQGHAMFPNYKDDQEWIIQEYETEPPKRGDVVIFVNPTTKTRDIIKRIIALPTEKIKIINGKILINNQPLDEPYLQEDIKILPGIFINENEEKTVPIDNYFVLGDNRNYSSDSREWGFISKDYIKRKLINCYSKCQD